MFFPIGKTFGLEDIPAHMFVEGFEDVGNPYVPKVDPNFQFNREFLRESLDFLTYGDGDVHLIIGPTGSGKTSGYLNILGRLNWPVQMVAGHGRFELGDLIGGFRLKSPSPDQPPVMQYEFGPLPMAMKHGHVLMINEADYIQPSEIAGLNDIIEGRPLVIPELQGMVIKPHERFRVVFTQNSKGKGNETGDYHGVLAQNLALLDRTRVTLVNYLSEADESALIAKVYPEFPAVLRSHVLNVANDIRKAFLGDDSSAGGELTTTMSTRTLLRWIRLSMRFRGSPNNLQYGLEQALLRRLDAAEKMAIAQIAKVRLGENWIQPVTNTASQAA